MFYLARVTCANGRGNLKDGHPDNPGSLGQGEWQGLEARGGTGGGECQTGESLVVQGQLNEGDTVQSRGPSQGRKPAPEVAQEETGPGPVLGGAVCGAGEGKVVATCCGPKSVPQG